MLDACLQALESGADLGEYSPSGVYEARAYAHIKLQQWMEAVQDASKAVELDSNNAKAYLRKGYAPNSKASAVAVAASTYVSGQHIRQPHSSVLI
jgi:Flp pilus assembly protein TadD